MTVTSSTYPSNHWYIGTQLNKPQNQPKESVSAWDQLTISTTHMSKPEQSSKEASIAEITLKQAEAEMNKAKIELDNFREQYKKTGLLCYEYYINRKYEEAREIYEQRKKECEKSTPEMNKRKAIIEITLKSAEMEMNRLEKILDYYKKCFKQRMDLKTAKLINEYEYQYEQARKTYLEIKKDYEKITNNGLMQ